MRNKKGLLTLAIGTLALSACGHEHNFEAEYKKDDQYHWHSCNGCEEKDAYAEHTLTSTIVQEATCIENGKEKLSCNICGYEKINPILKVDHSFETEWLKDDTNHWHKCKWCDEKNSLGAHQWDEGVVTTQPTYESEGKKKFTCTTCGKEKFETIETLVHSYSTGWYQNKTHHWHQCLDAGFESLNTDYGEHDWDEGYVYKQPTYDEKGTRRLFCNICNAMTNVDIDKLEHKYSATYSYSDTHHWQNCLDKGFETLQSNYGEHDWTGNEEVIEEATYDAKGSKRVFCKYCDASKIVEVEKLEHTFGTNYVYDSNTHWHPCLDAGFESLKSGEEPHDELKWEAKTNEDLYHYAYCKTCSKSVNDYHNYVLNEDKVTASCSACGYTVPYLTIDVQLKPLVVGDIGCTIESITSNIPLEDFGVTAVWQSVIIELPNKNTVNFNNQVGHIFHQEIPAEYAGCKIKDYNFYLVYETGTKAIYSNYIKNASQTLNIDVTINGYKTWQKSGMSTDKGYGRHFSVENYSPAQTITDTVQAA